VSHLGTMLPHDHFQESIGEESAGLVDLFIGFNQVLYAPRSL
jgi:hypothetical protein